MKKIIIIILSITFLFIIASGIITKLVYDRAFPRFDRPDETIHAILRYQDIEENYPRISHQFESDENTLQGYFFPQDSPHGLILIAHGLGGGADSYLAYTKWFIDHGWAVFSYDATGSYDSEGQSTKGFPQSLIDIKAALNYIQDKEEIKDLDVFLFGHSWGGYAVANALHFFEDIKAVVSVAAPSNANEMIFEQTRKMMGVFAYTQKPFLNLYQRLLFSNYAAYDATDAINNHEAHVMIIHGKNDEVFDYDGSALIAKQSQITNPNTVFLLRETIQRDGHNNLFRSDEAILYLEEINNTYRELYQTHNENIPYEIKQSFYETVDRLKLQSLDDELMIEINQFYLNALTNQ
jgi:uncharacterized protein